MRVLLISTYELGHQPLQLASPTAALEAAGHQVRTIDLSVEQLDPVSIEWAEAIGISVPMHTAMRLAIGAAEQIRVLRPRLPICFYGLYAAVSDDLIGGVVDRLIAGEYESELLEWVETLGDSSVRQAAVSSIDLGRHGFHTPNREELVPLDHYAKLERDGEEQLAGYVEASHGCVHKCRHCPVPVVYDGRIRIVESSVVLADIAQLVAAGAKHITFGDPDFLNGVKHSLKVARELHQRFPEVTFDCTTKVEHILEHREIWPKLSEYGCLFVISAFESLNPEILTYLDKGHTAKEAARAVALLREHGIEIRPSWLPFTPWTTPQDILEMFDFVIANEMVGNVDPIQYTIRLLVPKGSLLLDRPEIAPYLGDYDRERLTYVWHAGDPQLDLLHGELAKIVEADVAAELDSVSTFRNLYRAVADAAGRSADLAGLGDVEPRPRLTEAWFCCAEPTDIQLASVASSEPTA
jgi:radical SAM superfamily enzyme YgiQ (UPF0313 family)